MPEDIQPHNAPTLYSRLGGYDGISAVCENLLSRLENDQQLGRFWMDRAQDATDRELQFLKDFFSANAGGPVLYMGRDMKTAHRGMGINKRDWAVFLSHVTATLDHFGVAAKESDDVFNFLVSFEKDIVE